MWLPWICRGKAKLQLVWWKTILRLTDELDIPGKKCNEINFRNHQTEYFSVDLTFVLLITQKCWNFPILTSPNSGVNSVIFKPLHRDAFFQFLFRWIHYCHNSKSTGKENGKTHLSAVYVCNRGDTILHHGGLHTDLNQCNQGSLA